MDDAIIYSGDGFRSTNFQGNEGGNIGRYANSEGDYGVGRMLVNFPGLFSDPIFTTYIRHKNQIIDAEVNIYQQEYSTGAATLEAYIFNGNSWNESTITCESARWNSYYCCTDYHDYTAREVGEKSYNITPAVQLWRSDSSSRKGIIIKNLDEINIDNCKMLTTIENTNTITTSDLYFKMRYQRKPDGIEIPEAHIFICMNVMNPYYSVSIDGTSVTYISDQGGSYTQPALLCPNPIGNHLYNLGDYPDRMYCWDPRVYLHFNNTFRISISVDFGCPKASIVSSHIVTRYIDFNNV